ncbi:hypothetical protein NMY22_g14161 [Coprinellus aureogranulatus]|nr:hypothetical protein NMY22_g14161 [Coprinellus aureogranulatus]
MRLTTAALVFAAVILGGHNALANLDFEDTGVEARDVFDFEEFDARAPETVADFDLDARFADFEDDGLEARFADFEDGGLELEVREVLEEAVDEAKGQRHKHKLNAGHHKNAAAKRRLKAKKLRKAGLKKAGAQQHKIADEHEAYAAEHQEVARELAEDIELAERPRRPRRAGLRGP